jgi:hypothetical protein
MSFQLFSCTYIVESVVSSPLSPDIQVPVLGPSAVKYAM